MNKLTWRKYPVALALGASFCISSVSYAGTATQALADSLKQQLVTQQFDGQPSVVVKGLMLIRLKNGQFVGIPEGSGYVIVDPVLMDTKTGKVMDNNSFISSPPTVAAIKEPSLSSVTQSLQSRSIAPAPVKQAAIDVSTPLISMEDLTYEKAGSGALQVTVFVDPLCPSCHKFLSDFRYSDLGKDITFHIVPVSVISNKEEYQKADELLSAQDNAYSTRIMMKNFPAQATSAGIKAEANNRASYFQHKFSYVPAFVLPDGTTFQKYRNISDLRDIVMGHKPK